MTTRFDPFGEIRQIRPVTRSETSALRSGRNAIPHGTRSPVAIVLVAGSWAVAVPAAAARASAAAARVAARRRIERRILS